MEFLSITKDLTNLEVKPKVLNLDNTPNINFEDVIEATQLEFIKKGVSGIIGSDLTNQLNSEPTSLVDTEIPVVTIDKINKMVEKLEKSIKEDNEDTFEEDIVSILNLFNINIDNDKSLPIFIDFSEVSSLKEKISTDIENEPTIESNSVNFTGTDTKQIISKNSDNDIAELVHILNKNSTNDLSEKSLQNLNKLIEIVSTVVKQPNGENISKDDVVKLIKTTLKDLNKETNTTPKDSLNSLTIQAKKLIVKNFYITNEPSIYKTNTDEISNLGFNNEIENLSKEDKILNKLIEVKPTIVNKILLNKSINTVLNKPLNKVKTDESGSISVNTEKEESAINSINEEVLITDDKTLNKILQAEAMQKDTTVNGLNNPAKPTSTNLNEDLPIENKTLNKELQVKPILKDINVLNNPVDTTFTKDLPIENKTLNRALQVETIQKDTTVNVLNNPVDKTSITLNEVLLVENKALNTAIQVEPNALNKLVDTIFIEDLPIENKILNRSLQVETIQKDTTVNGLNNPAKPTSTTLNDDLFEVTTEPLKVNASSFDNTTNEGITKDALILNKDTSAIDKSIDKTDEESNTHISTKPKGKLSIDDRSLNKASSEAVITPNFPQVLNRLSIRDTIQENNVGTALKDTMDTDIIKNVRYMIKNQVQELKVKIYPKELGEMTIKILSEEGIMRAEIKATSKETYNLLHSNINEIKQLLNNETIKIQEVNIGLYSDDTTYYSGQSFGGNLNQNKREFFTEHGEVYTNDKEELIEELDTPSNSNVDLLV